MPQGKTQTELLLLCPRAYETVQIRIRSISPSVTWSWVLSYSLVVWEEPCAAIFRASSRDPPFSRYVVMPVALNVWHVVVPGNPAALALLLIML